MASSRRLTAAARVALTARKKAWCPAARGWLAPMDIALRGHDGACLFVLRILLCLALALEGHRRRFPRRVRRWIGSLRRVVDAWLLRERIAPRVLRGRPAWNRTPPEVEERIVRLHVEHPQLGIAQLRFLAERVLGVCIVRETVRRVLSRKHDLVDALARERRRAPRRIRVDGALRLWGADLTLVWILGIFPAWVLGVVDHHGSRLVAFERVAWPTAAEVVRVVEGAIARQGTPERILTDRGSVFRADAFEDMLAAHRTKHTLTRPAHPWTNGRIERVFRTFKETIFGLVWLVAGPAQLDRFCRDFLQWHNRDRPHGAWDGRTPDEVFLDRPKCRRSLGRVDYFAGRLRWFRLG
jgi:transposase InsO family protein